MLAPWAFTATLLATQCRWRRPVSCPSHCAERGAGARQGEVISRRMAIWFGGSRAAETLQASLSSRETTEAHLGSLLPTLQESTQTQAELHLRDREGPWVPSCLVTAGYCQDQRETQGPAAAVFFWVLHGGHSEGQHIWESRRGDQCPASWLEPARGGRGEGRAGW